MSQKKSPPKKQSSSKPEPDDMELFRVNDLLIGLDDDVFKDFAKRCTFRRVKQGDLLVKSGSTQNDIFFVIKGSVRIVQDDKDINVVYGTISEGGWFGEIAAIDKGQRTADAYALFDTVVAVAARALFLNLMLEQRQIAVKILESLATVVRSSNARVAEVSSFSGVQRVYLKLLELVDEKPAANGHWVIREMPSHDQLSAMASTSKETVTRALSQLLQCNTAKRATGRLEIINMDNLKRLATEV